MVVRMNLIRRRINIKIGRNVAVCRSVTHELIRNAIRNYLSCGMVPPHCHVASPRFCRRRSVLPASLVRNSLVSVNSHPRLLSWKVIWRSVSSPTVRCCHVLPPSVVKKTKPSSPTAHPRSGVWKKMSHKPRPALRCGCLAEPSLPDGVAAMPTPDRKITAQKTAAAKRFLNSSFILMVFAPARNRAAKLCDLSVRYLPVSRNPNCPIVVLFHPRHAAVFGV